MQGWHLPPFLWGFFRSERDGLVYVPESYSPEEPSPIVLALHSDSSTADEALSSLLPFAEEHRLILAAPESRGATWDKNCEVFNEDVAFIDRYSAPLGLCLYGAQGSL